MIRLSSWFSVRTLAVMLAWCVLLMAPRAMASSTTESPSNPFQAGTNSYWSSPLELGEYQAAVFASQGHYVYVVGVTAPITTGSMSFHSCTTAQPCFGIQMGGGFMNGSYGIWYADSSIGQVCSDGSYAPTGQSCVAKSLGHCRCGIADPIDVGSGNVYETATDYETAGQNQLRFVRYYNSRASFNTVTAGLAGFWRSNYDRYIRILSSGSVIAKRPDGQQISFVLINGTWTTDPDIDTTLSSSGTTWTLQGPDDTVETYTTNSLGNFASLNTIHARNGYTQTLTWSGQQISSITDSYNRTLTFSYSNGLLSSVTTPDGTTISYGYTAISGSFGYNLTSVTYPTSPASTVTYQYANTALPNALTGIIDENGNTFATWTYDGFSRGLTSARGGAGLNANLTSVAYNDTNGSRTVTSAGGVTDTYTFTVLQGIPKLTGISRAATSTTASASQTFSYDGNGYLASRTDWNGNQTTYTNNSHGLPTTINDAAGSAVARTTTIAYDSSFVRLPRSITTPGLATSFTYDTGGNVLTRTLTDTTSQTVPYSTNGQTRTWTNTWWNSLLSTVRTPNGNTTTFGYNTSGVLLSVTDALGHVVSITASTNGGLPRTIVDANHVTTTLTYDGRQRVVSSSVTTTAGARTTSYTYDAAGDLARITLPDNSYVSNTYDTAHRVTRITDALGNYANSTLDASSNVTERALFLPTNSSTFDRTASFDALGRMLTDNSVVTGHSVAYAYDANGNWRTVSDAAGNTATRVFDALNRLSTITDANTPAHGVTAFAYDAHDRVTSVTDPNGNTTGFVYDGFGEVIQETSPDRGISKFWYDADGNRVGAVPANNVTTRYTYDALDRMLTTTYPDSTLDVAYTYDQTGTGFGFGRLTSLTDASGSLSRTYDERGNVLGENRVTGGATLTTTYTYDPASRVASITYPSGAKVSYTRDAMGRVTAIPFTATSSDSSAVASSLSYEPFGPPTQIVFNNGDVDNYTYDKDYRTTGITSNALSYRQNLTYVYDQTNNLFGVSDAINPANSQQLRYDTLNRLTSSSSGTGGYGNLTYAYDKNGNLTGFTQGTSSYTLGLNSGTNRISGTTWPGNSSSFSYSPTGNITGETLNGSSVFTATYNSADRLYSLSGFSPATISTTYDAFGRRIVKTGPASSTTLYTYDQDDRLIEETNAGYITDYIYANGVLVADWQPSVHHLSFVHTDRIGVPIAATSMTDQVTWQMTYLPYGGAQTLSGSIVNNIRFPGQYQDLGTYFNYNASREYFPGLGRYIEADPIGLAGGMNPYLYANANPAKFTDRRGTKCDGLFKLNCGVDEFIHDTENPTPSQSPSDAAASGITTYNNGVKALQLAARAADAGAFELLSPPPTTEEDGVGYIVQTVVLDHVKKQASSCQARPATSTAK